MKKSALVLSGGGGLGVAHVGVLSVLEKKFDFDFLTGSSAGAIVAAGIACGVPIEKISELLHRQNFFMLAFDFSSSNFGFLRGEKVFKLLREVFQDRTFEDLPKEKELIVCATDFQTGELVKINTGDIASAVRASLSVPILFEPFFHKERWLVDGGLSSNFPLDIAITQYKGEKIIGVDVSTDLSGEVRCEEKKLFGKILHFQPTLERTFRILFKSQQRILPYDDRTTILRPKLCEYSTLDLGKLKEIEKKGVDCVLESNL
jgi:NTE family protein